MGGIKNTLSKWTGGNDTIGRIGAGLLTGGLSEFTEKNSFGVPSQYAMPLKIGAGTVAGGLLGGPGGALLGGTMGGALGGNVGGGALGGGIGALLQSLMGGGGGGGGLGGGLGTALGGSMLGYGMSMDPRVGDVAMPNWAQNAQAIEGEKGSQRSLIDSLMGRTRGLYDEQNSLLGQRMQNERDNLMRQLTTGPEGEAFRTKYNSMGLLNSGAFNTGLSDQFANLAGQQQNDILNQQIAQTGGLSNILNQGYGVESGLGLSGLQRQFGLQDTGTQIDLARQIQNAMIQQQKQNALLQGGSYLLGQGMGGGGMGGGMAGGGGGGMGGSIGNLVQSLMGGIGTGFNNLKGLFGAGGGGTTIGDGSSLLNLNPGDPYGLGAGALGTNLGPGANGTGLGMYPGGSSGVMRYWGGL